VYHAAYFTVNKDLVKQVAKQLGSSHDFRFIPVIADANYGSIIERISDKEKGSVITAGEELSLIFYKKVGGEFELYEHPIFEVNPERFYRKFPMLEFLVDERKQYLKNVVERLHPLDRTPH